MKQSIFTLILTCVIILFSQDVNAKESKWDGTSFNYSWYTNGSGATYHISTAADLAGLSKCFSDGYYKYGDFSDRTIILDNDIDLAGYEWNPIGSLSVDNVYTQFAGTFDGNNHTIKGLYISSLHGSQFIKYAGLFGFCPFEDKMTIKNLKVEGRIRIYSCSSLSEYGSVSVGGILGDGIGMIENCSTNIDISVDLTSCPCNQISVGGICGNNVNSIAVNLHRLSSTGTIEVSGTNSSDIRVGGIIGNIPGQNTITSYLSSSCNIIVSNGRMSFVGGIIGAAFNSSLSDAIFTGNITVKYTNYGLVGGIAGQIPDNSSNCIMLGTYNRYSGTAYMSPITGVSSSSMIVSNSYYLSGLSHSNGFGVAKTESDFKSGIAIDGYDTDEWVFEDGKYPYLSFTHPKYTLDIALEGGYLGEICNEGTIKQYTITNDDDTRVYQVLWDNDDITENVVDGVLTTPSINSNVTLLYNKSVTI